MTTSSTGRPPTRSTTPQGRDGEAFYSPPSSEPGPPLLDAASAAAIAHHVKNPLAGVRGAVEFLGSRIPGDGEALDVIGKIVARIDELDTSLDALLHFLRPPPPKLTRVNLKALLEPFTRENELAEPLRAVSVTLSGDSVVVNGDEEQLHWLVLAILTNVAEASPNDSTRVKIRIARGSRFVTVSFIDYGKGIPPKIVSRIFDPFFTTKARALGLGLTIASRTARTHGGWLTVHPRDTSTELQLTLPLR